MFFKGRMRRQEAMALVCVPLVDKIKLIVTEMLKKQLGEETKFPAEILWFSMWFVFLGYSTAKPNATKKEDRALNDVFDNIFSLQAMEMWEVSDFEPKPNVFAYTRGMVKEMFGYFNARCIEYNNAFDMDKGVSFATPLSEYDEYVQFNLLPLYIKNTYGEEYAIPDPSKIDRKLSDGFNDFFVTTMLEVTTAFGNLKV